MIKSLIKIFMKRHTATLLKENIPGYRGAANLYRLDPPFEGYEYVIVRAAVPYNGEPETCIFPSNREEKILSYVALPGSFSGELNHALALNNAGYWVVHPDLEIKINIKGKYKL